MSSTGSLDLDDVGSSGSPGSLRDTYQSQNGSSSRGGQSSKKQKVTRSKTACLPCRSRRSRCGALPPDPCPSCILHNLECIWISADGRRGRGRPRTKSMRGDDGGSRQQDSSEAANREASPTNPQQFTLELGSTIRPDVFLGPPFDGPQRSSPANQSQSALPPWGTDSYLNALAFTPWQHDPNQSTFDNASTLPPPEAVPGLSRLPQSNIETSSAEASFLPKRTILRYHGRTGMVPGFEQVEVTPSVDTQPYIFSLPLDQRTLPSSVVIQHILDLYFTHFAGRFPFFVRSDIREDSPQFPFLFHCMGALVARFSDHPEICNLSIPRHAFGNGFYEQAKRHVGDILGLATRETILGLLLLVEAALGKGSRTEMWMFMGMAVRLSLDSSLHMAKAAHIEMSDSDRRLDRLLFWSVLVMDYSLSLVEGRRTSIRSEEITQELPREDDVPRSDPDLNGGRLRSPFPFAAEMIMTFGPAIDIFNNQSTEKDDNREREASIRKLRAKVAAQYDELPLDMMWNAANLQKHYRAGQGPIYLFLHLWNHTIQCSRYLYDPGKEVENIASFGPTGKSDRLTLQSIQAGSWLHCARFVGDMLVLADVIDPHLYLAIPSVNHCFFVAGRCFLEDLKIRLQEDDAFLAALTDPNDTANKKEVMSRALFRAIAFENIKSLKQGIAKQAVFWCGVAQVLSTFESQTDALPWPAQPRGEEVVPSAAWLPLPNTGSGSLDRAIANGSSHFDPVSSDNPIMSVARNSDLIAMLSSLQSSDLSSTTWNWLNSARPSPVPVDIFQLQGTERG
ncbi:hypothetical protein BCR39DRAFT_147419 [Naematelia encephala]|uniref:Zn(2)-C6 fungal-type domain-containing protein n=1 Tax=Naematelia encephala TaxID=71784 RepID=A0A1Y2BJY1_9TREE|nr:hypothetical protein BCR39DRAFT_147419 [Naematelia encephala]